MSWIENHLILLLIGIPASIMLAVINLAIAKALLAKDHAVASIPFSLTSIALSLGTFGFAVCSIISIVLKVITHKMGA